MSGTKSRQELQHPECGDLVARVLGPAQQTEHILHVPRLEELETAVLHERDIAPAQLDLEQIGMVRGAHQHRLPFQIDPALAVLEHPLHDVIHLRLLVLRRHEQRLLLGPAGREQVLGEAFATRGRSPRSPRPGSAGWIGSSAPG